MSGLGINGATPSEEPQNRDAQKNVLRQQEKVTLSSIFGQDSDGGEEMTQNEYNQLSAEDRKVVDSWRELINKYLGKDKKLTKSNIFKAEQKQFIKAEKEEILKTERYNDNVITVNMYLSILGMTYEEVILKLENRGIDIKDCSNEDLEKVLQIIKKEQDIKKELNKAVKQSIPKFGQ